MTSSMGLTYIGTEGITSYASVECVKQRVGLYLGILLKVHLALQHWQSQWHTALFGGRLESVP